MMIGIIVKQMATKLHDFLAKNNGKFNVTPEWVNNWLNENNADLAVKIVGRDGQEIIGATVLIAKKKGT